jgi:hypothetical protein
MMLMEDNQSHGSSLSIKIKKIKKLKKNSNFIKNNKKNEE